jgi:hypothetical protein
MKWGLQPVWVGVVVLIAVVASGCGGSDGDGAKPAAATVNANYKEEKFDLATAATQICKQGLEQADVAMHSAANQPVPKKPSPAPDWEAVELPVKVVLPAFRRMAWRLGRIKPPAGDEGSYARIMERFRIDLRQVEKHPDRPISSGPFRDVGKAAYAYGIHDCLF